MPKKYEMSFELNGDIDPRLTRTFDTLSKDVTGLGKDFDSLKKTKGFNKITKDAEEAKGAFHDLRENAKEFGEVFEKTLQFTGAHKIITAVGDMFGNMISEVGALDDSVHQMGAATGATTQEMAKFKDITKEIYKSNLGEGFNDIASALVNVQRMTKQSGDELERTTKNALMLRDAFGYDVNESVRSADMLMRQFGLTSEQAYNLMAQGSQKGLDKTGELLDTINEFSPQFATLGFSANEMFDFLSTGLDAGAWNLDKVGDLVKEFDNRLKDAGDTANRDALTQLFAPPDLDKTVSVLTKGSAKTAEYLELVAKTSKDTAKQLVTDLKAGGTKGSKAMQSLQSILGDSTKMLSGLSNGSIKGADAFQLILTKLAAIDDPIQRQTLGIAIMGTQYEDLGQKVVGSLTDVDKQYDKTLDTMQQIEDVKYSSVTKDIQSLGRELMNEVIIPIGEDLMPVLQDMTAWAKDNKDLIKTLALAVPAGMITKNAVSMGKDFSKVGKTLLGTTGNVTKFGSAIGLLTNPVGLAVGVIGGLTLGVIAYKKHQEAARQELINMGDALDKAYDDYSGVEEQTKKTKTLITEYDRLTTKINDASTPAAILTEARRKLAIVEQDLIDLNPDILRAEDAKSESFREQLGLADQLNTTRSEMQRRELEMSVMDGKSNMSDLIAEYDRLNDKLYNLDDAYKTAQKSYTQYSEFVNRHHEIVNDQSLSYDQVNQKLQELATEMYNVTGLDYSGNFANMQYDAMNAKDAIDENYESWKKTQEEILKSEESFQSYYDAQKKLIEMDLGATLKDQAAKYKELSEAEKRRFDDAMKDMSELNRAMDMIPDAKKVNIELIWQQSGIIPDFSTPAGKQLKKMELSDPGFEGYADGGIANKPSIFGEAGPEIAIPLNNKPRSQGLLDAANQLMGRGQPSSGGGDIIVQFSPKINVTGGGSNVKEQVTQAVTLSLPQLKKMLQQLQRENQRVEFS